MSLLADYHTLLDGRIIPSLATTGSFRDFPVPLPSNFFQSATHMATLTFRIDTNAPINLTFRIQTSKFPPLPPAASLFTEFTANYSADVAHTLHELINVHSLLAGATNTIRFERTGGIGGLELSDIVLHYKRNVTTANLSLTP